MLIGKYTNAYGEEYWASGETIQNVLFEIEASTGDAAHADQIEWFRAMPVKVTCKTTYTIEDR